VYYPPRLRPYKQTAPSFPKINMFKDMRKALLVASAHAAQQTDGLVPAHATY